MKFYFLVGILALSCSPSQNDLKTKITKILAAENGTFAVAFKDLSTGESLLINEHELFHAASTMKTPVMVEAFKRHAEGSLSLDDSITLKNEFKSIVDGSSYSLSREDDSEQELYNKLGQKRRLSDLVYDMIIASSNLATNIVIELVDAKSVTATMRTLGANDIKVVRGVEDSKAYEKGLNNVTTAYDLLVLFEKLAEGELVSQDASQKMEKILLDQKFNEMIPALLPKDLKVAHKTGNITGVRHDSGYVILPNGKRYVIVLLSKNLKDENAGVEAMAKVSKIIYEHVISN